MLLIQLENLPRSIVAGMLKAQGGDSTKNIEGRTDLKCDRTWGAIWLLCSAFSDVLSKPVALKKDRFVYAH